MLRRSAALGFLVTACGCGGGGGATQIVPGNAVLQGLSTDSMTVASFTDAQRHTNGTFTGTLQISPIAGGPTQTLDSNVAGATFGRGTTLYYLADATQIVEGTPPRPRSYGTLKAWVPSQAAPVTLGTNVGAFSVSRDGSAVVFIERGAASVTAAGALKIWSTTLCAATCAGPIIVVDGVSSAESTLATDGKHILIDVPPIDTAPPEIVLATFPGGTTQTVSSPGTLTARSGMLSPDGLTAAWIENDNDIVSVDTSAPTVFTVIDLRAPDSSIPKLGSAQMVSPTTFVASVTVGSDEPILEIVTSAGLTPLAITAPVRFGIVAETPADLGVSTRYLFYASAQDGDTGAEDLWVQDLQNPASAPVQLAETTSGNPAFSDDGTTIRFFENLDLDTTRGDLYVATLPAGDKSLVATDVRNATFVPGTTGIDYIGMPNAADVGALQHFPAETGARTIPGVANFGQSRTPPSLYYTQQLGAPSDGVYRTDPL